MKKAKQWALFAIGLIGLLPISAQENSPYLLPSAPNRNGAEPAYGYSVLAPEGYESQASSFSRQIEQEIEREKLALTPLDGLDELPDVVFILDNASAESRALNDAAKKQGVLTVCYPAADASAKKAFKFLKNRYYSGLRPTYSTVFSAGDGYNNFRIPSVIATKDGTIVAFSEARAFEVDQAENDLVCRRSNDMGKTWGERIVIAEQGESSLNNPLVIYLKDEDRILLLYQNYPPKLREGVAQTSDGASMRSYSVYSDDGGLTWSQPREITEQLRPEGISQFCTGPGIGIEMTEGPHKGRLIAPCNAVHPKWFNYLAYSDDRGETWQITTQHSSYGSNESQVVQTGDEELLINARYHINKGDKNYLAPEGWNPWQFDKVVRNRALIRVSMKDGESRWVTESRTDIPDALCQGSIIRYSGAAGSKNSILLLSNASSAYSYCQPDNYARTPPMRINGSVRYSLDEGHTWSAPKRIYGNRFTEFQYSVLVPLANNKVGCIFEANEHIKFAVFDLEWLME